MSTIPPCAVAMAVTIDRARPEPVSDPVRSAPGLRNGRLKRRFLVTSPSLPGSLLS
jgi:hypothetical protein